MKITKNHVYVLLIAAAATAWAIDRFLLNGGVTGPAPANASALLVTPGPAGAAAPLPTPVAIPDKPHTLAARFQNVTLPDNNPHDAFAPPESWLTPQPHAAPAAASAPAPEAPPVDVPAFRSAHKLTAVFRTGPSTGYAVIDGKMVELGKPFAGFTLAAIMQTTVTLRGQGAEFDLEIDATSGHGTLSPSASAQIPTK